MSTIKYSSEITEANIISIMPGTTYTDKIYLTDEGGNAYPLTDYTPTCQIRDLYGNLIGEMVCTVDTPATDGIITRTCIIEITGLLTAHKSIRYVWGMQLAHTDGSILPEIQGGVNTDPKIVEVTP